MPIREAIVDSIIPRQVEKPIPVRTVSTRTILRQHPQNIDQQVNPVGSPAAESVNPAESVKLSPQLTALARKEQAYRQREQALKEREKQFEARLTDADKYSQLKSKASTKDYSEFESLGLSYEGYTEYLLQRQAGEDPTSEKFKALETEIQGLKKTQEEKATQEYEETVAAYKSEIAKLIDTSAEFSKTKKAGKQDAVLQLILDSWEEDQTELTVEQAAKDVESYLIEEAKKWASLVEEPKTEEVQAKLPPPRLGSRTLTQQMQPAGVEKQVQKSLQHLSESERYAEARRRVMARRQTEGR